MNTLREYIRGVLTESKRVTLASPLQSDLEQAIFWLKNNKKVKSIGQITRVGDIYKVRMHHKGTKEEIKALVSDRFGRFVRVQ